MNKYLNVRKPSFSGNVWVIHRAQERDPAKGEKKRSRNFAITNIKDVYLKLKIRNSREVGRKKRGKIINNKQLN